MANTVPISGTGHDSLVGQQDSAIKVEELNENLTSYKALLGVLVLNVGVDSYNLINPDNAGIIEGRDVKVAMLGISLGLTALCAGKVKEVYKRRKELHEQA